MQQFTVIGALLFLVYISSGSASVHSQTGVCRYGRRLECCYGWKKNSKGQCEAQCEQGCKHGECVGPNKCKCFPGYTGKTCNQDLNECGLKPRPCEHRCMNTYGSYMCYCLNGYMLMPDGSCANSRTCSLAHCQYGCEEVEGEIRCLCPSSGLQLGPDERTCVDIDECVTGKNLCPYNRQCVNTFGSYYCKCQNGYDLKYVGGKYDCVDHNECEAGVQKCSHHAMCLNTEGSYRCRCKSGFRGNGFECSGMLKTCVITQTAGGNNLPPGSTWVAGGARSTTSSMIYYLLGSQPSRQGTWSPKNPIVCQLKVVRMEMSKTSKATDPGNVVPPCDGGSMCLTRIPFLPTAIPESPARTLDTERIKNLIPEPVATQPPKSRQQPFDYDGEVYIGSQDGQEEVLPEKEEFPEEEEGEFILDCNFDQGACEWVQDKSDDMDWTVAYHEKDGRYYMAMSGLLGDHEDVSRLKLLLSDRTQQGSFCLTFDFRVAGHGVGVLRVLLDNNVYPVWEQSYSRAQGWQTELLTVAWKEEAPASIIFEAQRGNGVGGEIGLDNVVLTSGSCQVEDDETLF
ncbi:unnamed protein product [Merluccius merluccius]